MTKHEKDICETIMNCGKILTSKSYNCDDIKVDEYVIEYIDDEHGVDAKFGMIKHNNEWVCFYYMSC